MECAPCGKQFTGRAPYEQHMASEKHKKKAASYEILKSSQTSSALILNERNYVNKITCDVCCISFDSLGNYKKHVSSREHAEKIKHDDLKRSLDCSVVSTNGLKRNDNDEGNNHASNENICTDPILLEFEKSRNPQFLIFKTCDVCSKEFSGPEPYRQHQESAAHQKKVALHNGILQKTFFCEPCQKTCTGQIPYNQHLSSDAHKKKVKTSQFLGKQPSTVQIKDSSQIKDLKMTENVIKGDNNNLLFCNICNIFCCGDIPFQQHLQGIPHLKKKARYQNTSFSEEYVQDSSCKSGPQNGNHLQPNNKSMETDHILPGLVNNLHVMSTEEIEDSITMFSPDEEIDFDKPFLKGEKLKSSI